MKEKESYERAPMMFYYGDGEPVRISQKQAIEIIASIIMMDGVIDYEGTLKLLRKKEMITMAFGVEFGSRSKSEPLEQRR